MDTTLEERKKNDILEAALNVFSEKGYHAAKIEDIAAELKMGHGTFYRYFKNKLDIFNHVVDEVIKLIAGVVYHVDHTASNSLEEYRGQLVEIGDSLFGLFKENPGIARVLFYEAFGINDPEIQQRIRGIFDLFGQYTELYFRNGIEKGFLRKDMHVKETALAVNAALFEACRRVVSSPEPERDLEVWKETIISLLLEGLPERA